MFILIKGVVAVLGFVEGEGAISLSLELVHHCLDIFEEADGVCSSLDPLIIRP